jgi:leucyl-tRNA synthetase
MAAKEYKPAEVEAKWRKYWEDAGTFRMDVDDPRPKYYALCMFPYPSNVLHVGHGRNYILGDVLVRYKLMRGFNVLSPMGYDAFGLPAENAAIETGTPPAESTRINIENIRRQLKSWGLGYDWDREISTCEPDYYKWTQWVFLKVFERGLAYRKNAPVNWCTKCNTGLANEEVVDGLCERCGAKVETRELPQWYFRITEYADRLLEDLGLLGEWPEKVRRMQANWIGRSEGSRVDFQVAEAPDETISVFTTRPDTLFGVTFMVLAPEHPLVAKLLEGTPQRDSVLSAARQMSELNAAERTNPGTEKIGVLLGRHVINPANGEKVPLMVANYALMEYGTGAVMGVPAHDQRDFLFAKKYDLPVRVVIKPPGGDLDAATMEEAFEEDGVQTASAQFDGMPNREAIPAITKWLAESGKGDFDVNYHLRDWVISRQRYWGAPIPVVHCEKCGTVPVPEKDLPVTLPEVEDFRPKGRSPLAAVADWVKTTCPKCSGPAERETDTIAQWLCSCWYFLRYLSPRDAERPFDRAIADAWMPVDQYVGGIEHAVLHLLYTRFIIKVLYDCGEVGFVEPFTALFTQGMITRWAYRCPKCNSWKKADEVHGNPADGEAVVCKKCGSFARAEMAKMSKSKLNVVNPDELIGKYGADTERLYTLFIGPPEKEAEWSDAGVIGAYRFINRLWDTVTGWAGDLAPVKPYRGAADGDSLTEADRAVRRKLHQTIKAVTHDIENGFQFNTAIAAIMELLNVVRANPAAGAPVRREALEKMLLLLGPFVPHVAEELWETMGGEPSILAQKWPEADSRAAAEEELDIPVQVNGKLRGRLTVPVGTAREQLEKLALAEENVKRHTEGKQVKKVVVVPGKLVNVVVGD